MNLTMLIIAVVSQLLAGCVSTVPASAQADAPLAPPAHLGFYEPRAQLLLLGTFHFKNAGLDSYKPQHEVDVLSDSRQQEVGELLDRLAAFAPTRIAVEVDRPRQAEFDARFQKYIDGDYKLGSNEVYQLGFRLAERLGHERVWAIDADSRRYEPLIDSKAFAREQGQAWILESDWHDRYTALYQYGDQLKMRTTLRKFLLYLNSPERLRLGHGHYFVDAFKATDGVSYPGADNLAGWWYTRNLRIFANILQLTRTPEDRVLVIIGAGHIPILRHAAMAAPDVQLIEVADVL